MGGCGPVIVMRTGPHLGGGPDIKTGPDPAGHAPAGAFFGHRQHPRGPLITSGGCPMGAALCGQPVGHSARMQGNFSRLILVGPVRRRRHLQAGKRAVPC